MDSLTSVSSTSSGTAAVASSRGLKDIGSDDFMKILIKQMQFQDPFKPMDNEQMLAQMSQIRDMELSMTMTDTLRNLTDQQRFGGAAALIGKQVTGTVTGANGEDTTIAGTVSGVRFENNGDPVLELSDGTKLPLKKLTGVSDSSLPGGATFFIGKYVTGKVRGADGSETVVKGTVTAVRFGDDGQPTLDLDTGVSLPVAGIQTVSAAAPTAAAGSATAKAVTDQAKPTDACPWGLCLGNLTIGR